VNKALQRYVDAASGLTTLTSGKAEQVVKGLVRSGEAAGDQAESMVRDLLDRQQRNRDAVVALVKSETTRAVRAMGLATGTEVERLQKQVADLKRELTRVERGARVADERASTATKQAAASTVSADAAAAAAARAQDAVEEATAPAAVKKTATKKAATKKAATKKAATKKTATKRAATKKAVTKKTATKRAATKKAATKKTATPTGDTGLSPSATSDGIVEGPTS
jgi:polyhydroxyalkanoate synthesis regulator phasin